MKAIEITASAPEITLALGEVDHPSPGAGQILIAVHAAGVTRTELIWYPSTHTASGLPRVRAIPGHEFSGIVAALGSGVCGFEIDQQVFGMNDWFQQGAMAEYCLTSPLSIAAKPECLTHVQAATVPIGALTAFQGLFEKASLRPGERILIQGGAGAVGLFAVQLARQRGARVIATTSPDTVEFVRDLGAHQVVDYHAVRFEDAIDPVDVVFDTVGGDTRERSRALLLRGGRLITIAADGEVTTNPEVRNAYFIVEPNRSQLDQVAGMLCDGRLRTFTKAVVPLANAAVAFQGDIARKSGVGKIVVEVVEPPHPLGLSPAEKNEPQEHPMSLAYDSIIIGAGQAGPALAGRLTSAGRRVAFVERKLFGGTCVNTGCTPTKAMVASAYAARLARRAGDYGVRLPGTPGVDLRAVKARKDAIVAKSRDGVESLLSNMADCTVYRHAARFLSTHEVQVGSEVLTAPEIFLNVGGRPAVPPMPGVDNVPYLTSTTLLALETLPAHLIVVGGSYVGLEFAQMFRRFGSEVTVVEMGDRLVRHEDEDVSQAILQILQAEGIHFRLAAECISLAGSDEHISVGVSCRDGEPAVEGSHVLLAVGRTPNTHDLGLAEAGVQTDKNGFIVVDDQLRTNIKGIWALGDCNGKGAFTHTSYNDFEIVAANLLDNDPRRVSDRIHAHALYIDPPLGQIGMTEAEVRQSGKPALIGIRPMTKVSRAVEKGESQGFMKVLVDAETRLILGASILGTGGDEAIHSILDTMYAKAPYTTIQRAVHIHPTVSELIPTLLGDLKPLV